jgi:hypothetical protein
MAKPTCSARGSFICISFIGVAGITVVSGLRAVTALLMQRSDMAVSCLNLMCGALRKKSVKDCMMLG